MRAAGLALSTHVVIEAVGHMPAYEQAVGVVRPGGVISRVGVPQYDNAPVGFASLFGRNITLTGGPAPARAYIETLMPGILAGQVDPGRVFDREVALDQTPQGYQDMDARRALKVLVHPRDRRPCRRSALRSPDLIDTPARS
jgi:threonine dehydrogenase-like Zn-dependent dehydrogenase